MTSMMFSAQPKDLNDVFGLAGDPPAQKNEIVDDAEDAQRQRYRRGHAEGARNQRRASGEGFSEQVTEQTTMVSTKMPDSRSCWGSSFVAMHVR